MSEVKSVRRFEEKNFFPFTRWMNWFFMAASILLLFFTYYKAEIVCRGAQDAAHFKYYVISLTGVLFWGIVLRLRADIRANIVTVATSMVVGLYLVEGVLIFSGLGEPKSRAALAAELGIEYDKRTKLEVIEDLIAEGMDAVPTIGSAINLRPSIIGTNKEDPPHLFPLGGVANKTTVFGNESGEWLVYGSDRHGFNNPDAQWDSRTIEWLLIGDSFAQGASVQPGQGITGQIRSITRTDAISLGMGGNGPLVEYAALVEYGNALAPEKVLWIYYEDNDITDLRLERENPLLIQYMQDGFSQNLINRQKEIDGRLEEYISTAQAKGQAKGLLSKTRWIRLHAIRKIIGFDDEVEVDDQLLLFAKILTKAKARVEAWGGKLYFVYLPGYPRYSQKFNSHDRYRKKSVVIDEVNGLNIPVIDIHQEVFADHPDPLSLFPFRILGHYNKEGYSEVAKAIIANIEE